MPLAELPFDLVEVKRAGPSARPGTVAKADALAGLCASTLPFATVIAPAGYGKTTLVSQARCLVAQRGDRACRRGGALGELGLSAGGEFHPGGMTHRWTARGRICTAPMDEYKHHLRRLAVHDEALLKAIATDGNPSATGVIDEKTTALVRVAATIAVDAAPHSFQHAIALALAAGETSDEVVASLEAVTPVTGAARVVQCAPKVALALGYDVDAALERLDG